MNEIPKLHLSLPQSKKKNRIHIIDLEQSILMLRRALNFIKEIYEKRGSILCPSIARETDINKDHESPSFLALSSSSDTPNLQLFQSETRLPTDNATTTNKGPTFLPDAMVPRETLGSKQRRRAARFRFRNQKNQMSEKSLNRRSKIFARSSNETEDLVPRALLILRPSQNAILVKEAIKLQLPIIAVLDNKSDPSGIQFPIPGNGANSESLELYISCVKNAIRSGKRGEMRKIPSHAASRSGIAKM